MDKRIDWHEWYSLVINELRDAIANRGIDYVGQELVRLSTTPVWEQGRIAPRPFVLRVFAAATPHGWTILPGGFCRIAEEPDARAVSMGDGARSADVWVVSDKAVAASTLLPGADAVRIRRIAGVVPSRAADNLFWLGRYLERAEATLRLIRALGMPMRDPVKVSFSEASARSKFAFARSILLMKIMRGLPISLRRSQTSSVPTSQPATASTRISPASATCRALITSPTKSIVPGVSRKLI